MPDQPDLFGPTGTPLARTTDPIQSHRGATEIEASGRASSHRRRILEAVAAHPARTCRGLAELIGLEAYAVSKRLTELERADLIEPGLAADPSTRRARRWFATARGQEALR